MYYLYFEHRKPKIRVFPALFEEIINNALLKWKVSHFRGHL